MTGKQVSQVQADWGGEFRNNELKEALSKRGTISKETVLYHSETNAAIERAICTITIIRRAILLASTLPRNIWPDALKFTTYTKNQILHSALPDQKSPIEILDPSINILEE